MRKDRVVANKRILVANRGEIAIRIFRAATELNMRTIGIYSYEDRFAVHRFKADEAYQLGPEGAPLKCYLDPKTILDFASKHKIDFIHPGYGFLSENAEFAEACEAMGIRFCGPPPEILRIFGDKISAKNAAKQANVPTIPGSDSTLTNLSELQSFGRQHGFPLTLKANFGGGGKGIRIVNTTEELSEAWTRAKSEAKSSFGDDEIFVEKTIIRPRHIEVQILADSKGKSVHLYDRDCSIQRRHQKVVEMAPAMSISQEVRKSVVENALAISKESNFVGVGTVEFLVDTSDNAYFLEVNPRVQVEHTVTEMVTGIDIVQASILLSAGRGLDHPAISIQSQEGIQTRGVAIQCRITTEDPLHDFSPDTGKIMAYRPPQGFGVRLDEGLGTSGGLVTPYYDSLLVKVTTHGQDLYAAARKMKRALAEFRIRGVKTNIPLLRNIVSDEKFIKGEITTSFMKENPNLFKFTPTRDRATKLLRYIGEATVNNPHQLNDRTPIGKLYVDAPEVIATQLASPNAKQVFDENGSKGLVDWILNNNNGPLLTDTTMRDAHQSLFATRLRTYDIEKACCLYEKMCKGLFSLEVWGGATFDTSFRFLYEDPWERLATIREKIPSILLQMLIRGDNAVGYKSYPKWVIKDFIRLTCQSGLDVFRIFDCLNNPSSMQTAIESVKENGAIAEASICYTGDLSNPLEDKFTLKYYINVATELKKMGSDILAIKDMAGLLRPNAAKKLVKALREELGMPIHLHMHATSGSAEATLLTAINEGCHIVDGAISSMSGLTSQPSLNSLIACFENTPLEPSVKRSSLDQISPYWESVRELYSAFDPGVRSSTTRVYEHEIPGGQYSNLFDQARKVGLETSEFYELTERYQEVDRLFGRIVKVTPSSKVVGDFALLLQKNGLTASEWLSSDRELDFPDSVVGFVRGELGKVYGGIPDKVKNKFKNAKKSQDPESASLKTREQTEVYLTSVLKRSVSDKEIISYSLYPKVFLEYLNHLQSYSNVDRLPTKVFFYGLSSNEELQVELEPGKTIFIKLKGISDPQTNGKRKIFFELNGFPREIDIQDKNLETSGVSRKKADVFDPSQIPAPMPGKIIEVKKSVGDSVQVGDVIAVSESMKMEYSITAKSSGTIESLAIKTGEEVEEGDLLCQIRVHS